MAVASTTRIGRLCIRSTGPKHVVRLAVAAQLSGADLNPPALPPAAILIVRRLREPLPHRLAGRPIQSRPGRDWERAVRTRLADHYRKAARPAAGAIDPNAEAVLFQDESQMVACLALDLSSGRHLYHWWWRVPLQGPGFVTGHPLAGLLRKQARQLPAILAQLMAWRQAAPVIAALTPGDSAVVLAALLQEHALTTELLPLPAASAAVGSESVMPVAGSRRLDGKTAPAARPPPWRRWLPGELAQVLSREQEYLLGIGLALYYAPASASSSLFAAQVAGWWRDSSTGASVETKPSLPVAAESQEFLQNDVAAPDPDLRKVPRADRQDQPRSRSIESNEPSPSDCTTIGQQVLPDQEASTVTPVSTNDLQQATATSQSKQTDAVAIACGSIEDALSEGVMTRLGGVLYLINVLQSLDLSDNFEASWGPSSQFGGWGLLDSLARALLDEELAIYGDDPIWRALGKLDGREPGVLPQPQLVRWLAAALPYIHCRLSQALPPEAMKDCQFLKVPGWLYVTAAHVDLVAALDAISLPVRIAGLDRDPGWVAKLGRVVTFHFQ